MSSTQTILFLGCTGGIGLSTLRHALTAGHTCICLVRTPSRLSTLLSLSPPPSNLTILAGNAHSIPSLVSALSTTGHLPSMIVTSIGGVFIWKGLTLDDPHVCENGMLALLSALKRAHDKGITGSPRIVAVSGTGMTDYGRDIPLLMVPLIKIILAVPRADKKSMERAVIGSQEKWTVVRPSLLMDGEGKGKVRVGVEDPVKGVVESREVGWTIDREAVGRWIFEQVVEGGKWEGRVVSLTY
ncbi:hypothetical protein OQA88_5865 [Cercophora sp. LCS_1]